MSGHFRQVFVDVTGMLVTPSDWRMFNIWFYLLHSFTMSLLALKGLAMKPFFLNDITPSDILGR